MPGPGPFELVIVVALIVLAALVVYTLIVGFVRMVGRPSAPRRDPALDTLRTRFASGDIDEAEYERLRSALLRH